MAFSSNRLVCGDRRSGLLMSADRGVTWSLKPLGPLTTLPVQSVRVSPDGQRLWVVSLRGLVFSDRCGTSWAWHDLPLKSGGAVTLERGPRGPNTMVSIAHNGLYISRDAGNTWQQAAAGLPSTPVQDLAIDGTRLPRLHAHRGIVCFLRRWAGLDPRAGHAGRWLFSGGEPQTSRESSLPPPRPRGFTRWNGPATAAAARDPLTEPASKPFAMNRGRGN